MVANHEIEREAGSSEVLFVPVAIRKLGSAKIIRCLSGSESLSVSSGDVREQRSQFILVNNTKPLPTGLINELLPATEGELPVALLRRRYPAVLLEQLRCRGERVRSA